MKKMIRNCVIAAFVCVIAVLVIWRKHRPTNPESAITTQSVEAELSTISEVQNRTVAVESVDPSETRVPVLMAVCITSLDKMIDTKNRGILDEECNRIFNNIQVGKVKDEELVKSFTALVKNLNKKKLNDMEREKYAKWCEEDIENAMYDSMKGAGNVFASGGTPIGIAFSVMNSAISSYFNYKSAVRGYQRALDKKNWELEKDDLYSLNELRTILFAQQVALWDKYRLLESARLTENLLDNYKDALSESDPQRKLRMFHRIEGQLVWFPEYWYQKAMAYSELGETNHFMVCCDRYEAVDPHILRQDLLYAHLTLLRAQYTDANAKQEIRRDLKNTVDNTRETDRWQLRYAAALQYLRIGDEQKAKELLQWNIDSNKGVDISRKLLSDMDVAEVVEQNEGREINYGFMSDTIADSPDAVAKIFSYLIPGITFCYQQEIGNDTLITYLPPELCSKEDNMSVSIMIGSDISGGEIYEPYNSVFRAKKPGKAFLAHSDNFEIDDFCEGDDAAYISLIFPFNEHRAILKYHVIPLGTCGMDQDTPEERKVRLEKINQVLGRKYQRTGCLFFDLDEGKRVFEMITDREYAKAEMVMIPDEFQIDKQIYPIVDGRVLVSD